MTFLTDIENAAAKGTVAQDNFEALDESLAFALNPSKVAGVATTDLGPPTAGQHFLGELWRDALCAVFRCTVAGTPGTWVQIQPAIVAAEPTEPPALPAGYLIELTTDWSREYWDGAAWQAAG